MSIAMTIVSMVISLGISFPLAVEMAVSISMSIVAMVSMISMVAIVSVVGLSLPLTIVVPVSVVSEMSVSMMGITKVTVSMDESMVSVVSVVSVRRGFCLGFSLAEDCSHQEESEEHNGLHICGCEQARDPSRTPM